MVLPRQHLEINSAGVNLHEHRLRSSAGEIQASLGTVSQVGPVAGGGHGEDRLVER